MGREARAALGRAKPSYRTAISRAYYAMYHTCRGLVFFDTQGDDHQEHSELPKHLPADFPARATWENTIKNARLERNRADYEPYPRRDASFAVRAKDVCRDFRDFRSATRAYLRGKGLKT